MTKDQLYEQEKAKLQDKNLTEEAWRVCDNCTAQEGSHYCLLHGRQVKNMDLYTCADWEEKYFVAQEGRQ